MKSTSTVAARRNAGRAAIESAASQPRGCILEAPAPIDVTGATDEREVGQDPFEFGRRAAGRLRHSLREGIDQRTHVLLRGGGYEDRGGILSYRTDPNSEAGFTIASSQAIVPTDLLTIEMKEDGYDGGVGSCGL